MNNETPQKKLFFFEKVPHHRMTDDLARRARQELYRPDPRLASASRPGVRWREGLVWAGATEWHFVVRHTWESTKRRRVTRLMQHEEERREEGMDQGAHAGEEREGGAGLCGERHACTWQWLVLHGLTFVTLARGPSRGEGAAFVAAPSCHGWSSLETREATLTWGEEIGAS